METHPESEKKAEQIQKMFDNIASTYDRTNRYLSLGLHHFWNQKLVDALQAPSHSHHFLDLCTGTGEIAFSYLKQLSVSCKCYLLDFSAHMLDCAQKKISSLVHTPHSLSFLQADAKSIPLPDYCVDRISLAYGIRNIQEPYIALQEMYRVLKPGGRVAILELTRPQNSVLAALHTGYLKWIVPILGWLSSNNHSAYRYLNESVAHFMSPQEFVFLLQKVGFVHIQSIPLTKGIATLVIASKDEDFFTARSLASF
mgnify:CR=1 FL=1